MDRHGIHDARGPREDGRARYARALRDAHAVGGVRCPRCGGMMLDDEAEGVWRCENRARELVNGRWIPTGTCGYLVHKDYFGATVDEDQLADLVAGKAVTLRRAGRKTKAGAKVRLRVPHDGSLTQAREGHGGRTRATDRAFREERRAGVREVERPPSPP